VGRLRSEQVEARAVLRRAATQAGDDDLLPLARTIVAQWEGLAAELATAEQTAETREEWCAALEAEVERLRAAAALVSGPGGPGAGGR